MGFNWIDVVILIFISLVSLKGYRTGLIHQITTIVAIGLGIYMAAEQYEVFASFIVEQFKLDMQIASLLSFGIIIILVSIVVNYIGQVIERMLNALSLVVIDNVGGAIFGVVKGGLLIYIIILISTKLVEVLGWSWLQLHLDQSFLVPRFLELNPLLRDQINRFLEEGVEAKNG